MVCDLNELLLPGDWQTPTLNGGWTNDADDPVRYRLEGDVVRFSGRATGPSGANTAFTVSVDYRPPAKRYVAGWGATLDAIQVEADGDVVATLASTGAQAIFAGTYTLT
jgi:hypothetical protein